MLFSPTSRYFPSLHKSTSLPYPIDNPRTIRTNSHPLALKSVSDTPEIKQHFELTPSPTLLAAQSSLASELAPAISTLLSRADIYISKLERKQNNLIARSELLEGRLEGTRDKIGGKGGDGVRRQRSLEKLVRKTGFGGGEEKALRLKALRQKKERLGYAVERLQLQSQQRQRQLRMSVAAT
jgi:DASH complex subunit SPC19